MFLATLKELNLFVLPKPNFDIPASDFDHTYPQPRIGGSDLSCVSQTFNMQRINNKSSALEGNTARKKRSLFLFTKYGRVFGLKRPRSTANGSDGFPELQDPTIASIMYTRSPESIRTSSGAKVRIVTPANSPSSIRRRLREDMSLYICSPNPDRPRSQTKLQKKENICYGLSRKGKEKRNSAPPALTSAVFQTNEPVSPMRLPPPVLQKYQNQRLRSCQDIASNSSYPSKLFELDLSPIIEDVNAFNDQLPAPLAEGGQTDADSVDSPLDSSTTSYGELLYEKSADYFGLPEFDFFEDSYHDEKRQWVATVENRLSQQWQGLTLASMREEENCPPGDILPKLTLTLPTPNFDCPAELGNFDEEVFRRQTYDELPWSSCNLPAGVVDVVDEARDPRSPAPFHSCYPAFQTYDLDSYGIVDTLSHLDSSLLELDRFCNREPPLGHPAPLAGQDCIGSGRHASAKTGAPVLGGSTATRLGNGLSRFGRYLQQRIKLLSLSGTQHKHRTSNNNATELKGTTRTPVRGHQLPKSRDSASLNSPTEENLKKQAADKKLWRHSLISFVRGRT